MSASLPAIQARLKVHFAALAQLRDGKAPVFALEHDLSEVEIQEMSAALKASLGYTASPNDDWLAWVVYAAELGYEFDGEEYWRSFEERTPQWRTYGSRNQVRAWFRRFHREYAGIKPSGAWAGHFTIISWPITHAILPRDLQNQFARTLHYARHPLARAGTTDAAYLGQLIRREARHASSRFRKFTEQEELVGRLVLAILGAEEAAGDRLLRGQTLRRIVRDLEKTRQAKDWLEGVRSTIFRFKGANRLPTGLKVVGGSAPRIPAHQRPNLRPTLVLARTGLDQWEVRVEVPSFAELLNQMEELRGFVSRTRSKVAGGHDTFVPSSWLLGSNRTKKLLHWPGDGVPMVQFEGSNAALEGLLQAEGSLSKTDIRPCRVREDGTATEVVGRQVRPGQTYVLLAATPLADAGGGLLRPCSIECDGVLGYQLKVPASVSSAQEAAIAQLGLVLCRTVRVWPAGLAARAWDGEGVCDWLTTEKPVFGVLHDHPLTSYAISLDGGAETVVAAGQPGQAVFVTLSELEVGPHVLKIRAFAAQQGAGIGKQQAAEGMIAMTVREPVAWVPGTPAHGGLVVNVEPGTPDLDDFTNNRLHLQILGPDERHVEVRVRSLTPPSEGWLARRTITLPKFVTDWTDLLAEAQEDLAVSSRAELVVTGDELGEFRIPLEREALPLRWASKRGASTSLRLIDEAGDEQPPRVTMRSFARPAAPAPLDPDTCRDSFTVNPPGGLFQVEGKGGDDAIIVSVQPAGQHLGFDAVLVPSSLSNVNGGIPPSSELLDLINLWGRARAVGWLATVRKAAVLKSLEEQFYAQLCGNRWVEAEARFQSNNDLSALGERVGSTYDAKGFVAVIRRGQLSGRTGPQRAEWFSDIAHRYKICSDQSLSSLALRLATDPGSTRIEKADGFDGEVAKLTSFGILTRGARLAALLPDSGVWRWS